MLMSMSHMLTLVTLVTWVIVFAVLVQETLVVATPTKATITTQSTEHLSKKAIQKLLKWKPPKDFISKFPYEMTGRDRENHDPVWLLSFGGWDVRAVLEEGDERRIKMLKKYTKQMIYKWYNSVKPIVPDNKNKNKTKTRGIKPEGFILINDFDGYSTHQTLHLPTVEMTMNMFRDFYEIERNVGPGLTNGLAINLNFPATTLWNAVKTLMGELVMHLGQTENPIELIFRFLQLLLLGTPYPKLVEDFYGNDVKTTGDPRLLDAEYDFVIVGGGSAGSTLAGRLTENPKHSVLLLEAGGHPFPLAALTGLFFVNLGHSEFDWKDLTTPQKRTAKAYVDNRSVLSRGKMLGGGSSFNARLFQRGNPVDFDNWAYETKDSQWAYKNVLPYFKKLEDYNGGFKNDSSHGKGGPIPVHSIAEFFAPLKEEFLVAAKELGYPISNPNGGQKRSFFVWDVTVKGGRSWNTYLGYVEPNLERKNLQVQTYAHVLKVLFDENDAKKATGVSFSHFGQNYTVRARKEVIISAGALGSPQILMLSGIGPKEHLESFGIPVVADLPSGQYLQDHSMTYFGPFTVDLAKSSMANYDLSMSMANAEKWRETGSGVFSSAGTSVGAFTSSPVAHKTDLLDVLLLPYFLTISEQTIAVFSQNLNLKPGVLEKYFKNDMGKSGYISLVTLGLPKSVGRMKLKSTNPFDRMDIDPNYFENPDDVDALLYGLKLSLNISKTEAFARAETKLIDTPFPGCEEFPDKESDDYLRCYIKHWTGTMWHYCGTNRMGADPKTSVLDSKLRVHGLKGLRVVDSSVFPNITNANPNTPTIMVAERAADIIKLHWS